MPKRHTPAQRAGTEFGGAQQDNTVQPVSDWKKLEPHEKARLMKTTGQTKDPAARPSQRAWRGQRPE